MTGYSQNSNAPDPIHPEARPISAPCGVEKKILAGFIVALLLMLFGGGLTYRSSMNFHGAAQLVSHTQEVRAALSLLYANISDAQSTQRTYLITNQREPLDEYTRLIAKIKSHQEALAGLVADNPDQTRSLAELKLLIDRLFNLLDQGIALNQQQGFAAAKDLVASSQSMQVMQAIRTLDDHMDAREENLLVERESTSGLAREHTLLSLLLTVTASVGIFALLYRDIHREMVARSQAEDGARSLGVRLRTILDNVPDGVLTIDEHGIVRSINRAGRRIFGYDRAEVVGQNVQMLMPKSHDHERGGDAGNQIATGEADLIGDGNEVMGQHKDGSRFPVDLAMSEMTLDGQRRFTGIVRDITERKKAETALISAREEAESANRSKSTFLATMSHEIRTPMNGVLGMLEIMSLSKLDAEQRTTLETVRESGKSLLRVIDDILDFSKIEAGRLEIRPEVASIQEIVESVRNLFAGTASSKGLLLKHTTDPQISPAVLVDSLRLRQILDNFVSNALKFTPETGAVRLRAELMERAGGKDRIRFSVEDTGIGISATAQRDLFQPFRQVSGDTARHYGGSGLGLAICRRLADMMGGTIEMLSIPDKGTTVTLNLSLPIADPKDLPKTGPQRRQDFLNAIANLRRMAPSVTQAETEGTLVLVVDDHPTNRTVLLRQLHALGYAAESAENGLEGLDKWKSKRFGIVITDCHMPKMDGYELTRTIRGLESAQGGKRIPIVACTANALQGEAEACFAIGMDDYLAKPIELSELLKKLDQWLPIPATATTLSEASSRGSDRPEPNADADARGPVDRSVLAEISSGDEAAERDILSQFRRANEEDAAMLEQAVAQKNTPHVTLASHRIKGASRTVGARRLAGVCDRIEHASRANDWPAVEASMGAFHQERVRLNTFLDSLRGT